MKEHELQTYFYERYRDIHGRNYYKSFGKDMGILKRLNRDYGTTWIKRMIDYYLKMDDEFVKESGYTIGVFYLKINMLVDKVMKPILRTPVKPTGSIHIEKEEGGFTSSAQILALIGKDLIKGETNGDNR